MLKIAAAVAVATVAGLLLCGAEGRDPVLHRVGGGKFNWASNINFTEWSSHEHFYVGDWLYFGFDKHVYSVLEVNKTSYESCNEKQFIKNITKGGRDVFNLTQVKPYYFISGKGFCFQGMKVAVFVENYSPPLLPNNNSPNSSSPNLSPSIQPSLPLLLPTVAFASSFLLFIT